HPAAPPERGSAGSGREAAESGAGGAERAAELVAAALCAAHAEDRDAFDGALAALADAERPEWAAAASRALVSCLTSRLARAWRIGRASCRERLKRAVVTVSEQLRHSRLLTSR